MPAFDPNQFLAETSPDKDFNPDKFLADTGGKPPGPPEDQHGVVPFLKHTASGIVEGAKNAAGAVGDAVMHPLDTAAEAGNWMAMGGGPGGQEALVGERALRSAPVVGPAYDNVRALADPDYLKQKAEEDAQHAAEHPTLDKAQKLIGNSSGMLAGGIPGAGVYAVDAYHRSRLAGNDTETALKDGRNVAMLLGGGETLGAGAKELGGRIAESGVGDTLKGAGEEKAFKAAVGNQSKAYNEAASRGVINERGRELLDSGTVGFGDSAQQIADKAGPEKAATGQAIGGMLDELDQAHPEGKVSGQNMAEGLRKYASEIGGSGNKPLVSRLLEAADDLEKEGNMTFAKAQTHKNSWNWEPGNSVPKETARKVKGIIGGEMEEAIGRAPPAAEAAETQAAPAEMLKNATDGTEVASQPPEQDPISAAVDQAGAHLTPEERGALTGSMKAEFSGAETQPSPPPEGGITPEQRLEMYQALKSKYGTMAAAQKDAQVAANRYAKNNSASLGDKAAAFGAAALNPHGTAAKVATGAIAGVANKLIRKRGNSAAAVSLDKIGDMLNGNPEVFGKYAGALKQAQASGPQSLAVAHFMLSQQDPEYQQLIQSDGN